MLTTLNLANANSTTINFGGAGTQINVGAATGNTKVNNNLIANANIETVLTTLNLANANSTTVNFAGAATQINMGAATGNTKVNNNLIANANIETVLTTLNLANANSTTINFGGAGTQINVGASSGNTKINNNLIANANIETVLTTLNIANANSTTVNFAGAGTNVNIGGSSGNTTINNNLIVKGNVDTSLTTFNLANANATTINFGGAATTMNLGNPAGGTSFRLPGGLAIGNTLNFNYPATVNNSLYFLSSTFAFSVGGTDVFAANTSNIFANANLTVTGDITVNGGDIYGPATLNIGQTSSTIQMGQAGGAVGLNGNANVVGNLNASGNVVTNGAFKAGAITLIAANGFIYTNGDITGGNISANGLGVMYANGLITCATVSTGSAVMYSNGTIQASLFSGNGASLSSLPGANVTGTVANATYATSAGSATTATTATNAGFATSAGSATSAGFASSAASASYADAAGCAYSMCADVAEYYLSDADYEVGTVLEYGGRYEVTLSKSFDSHRFAGVVSGNPAVTMNAGLKGDHTALLALIGRVPVKVQGHIEKGDLMVCAPNGYAIANNFARAGTIIGKALEDFDGESGIIEIVVGRN